MPDLSALPNQQDVQTALDSLPMVATVLFAIMALVGVVIWLTGAALARAACVVSGLVLGGLAGWFLGGRLAEQGAYILPLTVGAAIAGALLAALLFRVWVALVGAVVLALVVPMAALLWQGHTPAPLPEALGGQAQVETEEAETQARAGEDEAQGGEVGVVEKLREVLESAEAERQEEGASPGLIGRFAALLHQVQDEAVQWIKDSWEALGPAGRMIAMMGAAIGAIGGLLLGLLAPHLSAAWQSSLAGSVMMVFGGIAALKRGLGDTSSFLPDTPRSLLLTIGLITVLGVVIQWMLFRKRADK